MGVSESFTELYQFWVEAHKLQVAGCRFEIFDLYGRKVDEIVVPPLQENVRMDVSGWNAGVYIAVLWGEDGIVGREKFVVTR